MVYKCFIFLSICCAYAIPVRYEMSIATSEMNHTLLPNAAVHNADFTPAYTATFSISPLFRNEAIKSELGYICGDCFHPYASFILENDVYYTDCDVACRCRSPKPSCAGTSHFSSRKH